MEYISCYSNKEELREFANKMDYTFTDWRHAQVIYLINIVELDLTEVADITDYTYATVRNIPQKYYDKVQHLLNYFVKSKDNILHTEELVKYRAYGGDLIPMCFMEDCGFDKKDSPQVYLAKFYTNNDEIPKFSKIGTTEKSVEMRIRQEIADYFKKGFELTRVEICKILPTGYLPPEAYESYLRAILNKKYYKNFQKNDRFFDTDISTEIFTKICKEFYDYEF